MVVNSHLWQGCANPRRQVAMATKYLVTENYSLWILSIEFALCHHSGVWNWEVAPGILQYLCIRHVCPSKIFPVYAMKACMGHRGMAPVFLNLGAVWRWMVKFAPVSLFPRAQRYPLSKGWMDLKAGLNDIIRTKISRYCWVSDPESSIPYHTQHTDCIVPARLVTIRKYPGLLERRNTELGCK